jgi:1,4-dihydroxy-2-naphthoate octaprenyltransferase
MAAPSVRTWLEAARLRTLPLALACIALGSLLAADAGYFNPLILALAMLTTLLYQVLSNYANDYYDWKSGADACRTTHQNGEARSVASGKIAPETMWSAVKAVGLLAALAGGSLVFLAFTGTLRWVFLGLHGLALWSAVNYVGGQATYGYRGWGDFFVVFFFGLVGVEGSFMVQTGQFSPWILLPGLSIGLLATGVLNLNNLRDIETDRAAGKITVAARLGTRGARWYQTVLVVGGVAAAVFFVVRGLPTCSRSYLFLAVTPLFFESVVQTWKAQSRAEWDRLLKPLALATFFFALALGVGLLIDSDACSKPLF